MKLRTESWLNFANADFKSAQKLLEESDLAQIVTFHCQQTIEKLLKAILEEYDVTIPKTHSLIKLYNLIPDKAKNELKIDEDDLIPIDKVYIDSRYPIDMGLLPFGTPDIDDAKRIFDITGEIYNMIITSLRK
ncbi:MAG: DNA-binding protein [Spirochaetae bacterium HGW-Spirochaetae-5]|nr:MAG: DNA-binding protein [Spirochaetae bacterium HGW-Spirochaetae-5]